MGERGSEGREGEGGWEGGRDLTLLRNYVTRRSITI